MSVGITVADIRRMSSEEGKSDLEIANFYGLKESDIKEIRKEYKIEKKRVYAKRYHILDEQTQLSENQESASEEVEETSSTGEENDTWF